MKEIIFYLALIFWMFIIYHFISLDWKKYKKNIPYTISKRKINLPNRIILGLMAGFHYLHFIGTYDHKKYNTQVFTPKTLECYLGILFALVLFIGYLLFSFYLKNLIGIYGLSILLIPIITNIISLINNKNK